MFTLARDWWLVALQGLAALLFGVIALVYPGATFEVLVLLFGAYALVSGLFSFTAGLWAAGSERRWWPLVLIGILSILAGVFTFARPGAAALALVYVIAAYAIVIGILEVVAAVELRTVIDNEWLLGLSGVLSVIFGVLVMVSPGAGALSLVLLFGIYAILYGVSLLGLGFRLRGVKTDLEPPAQMRKAA